MNKYDNDKYWDEYLSVFTYSNLVEATYNSTKGNKWKGTVISFLNNMSKELLELRHEIETNTYHVSNFNKFTINERGKIREIRSVQLRDRIVQHALCDNFIIPLLYGSFIYDNTASQVNKGLSFAINRTHKHLQQAINEYGANNIIVLQLDIHKFFESIDHDYIISIINTKIKNPYIKSMIYKIVMQYEKGLGLGSQACQVLSLLALNGLDHFCKESLQLKHYIRYMDDILILLNDKFKLKYIKDIISDFLNGCKFTLNDKKSKIYNISKTIHFLGFKFKIENNKIYSEVLPNKIYRQKRKLRKLYKKVVNNQIDLLEMFTSYISWRAFAMNGIDRHKIRMMDIYFETLTTVKPIRKYILAYINKKHAIQF